MGVLTVAPRKKRPVWTGPRLGLTDHRGAIPRGWCPRCGTEIFMKGKAKCFRCEKEVNYVHKKRKKPL